MLVGSSSVVPDRIFEYDPRGAVRRYDGKSVAGELRDPQVLVFVKCDSIDECAFKEPLRTEDFWWAGAAVGQKG